MKGIGVSPGIASGKVFLYEEYKPTIEYRKVQSIDNEIQRLKSGIDIAKAEIEELYSDNKASLGDDIEIFTAHIEILEDPELLNMALGLIKKEEANAEWAILQTINSFISIFQRIDNDYMKSKIIDLRDVSSRLIKALIGDKTEYFSKMDEGSILVAKELTPSYILNIDKSKVKGIITESGGLTSHSTIISRAKNIPMVIGVNGITKVVNNGKQIILDGSDGQVIINPNEKQVKKYDGIIKNEGKRNLELRKFLKGESITKDGFTTRVMGNITSPDDIESVIESGGEGVGLFRTENLYFHKMPSEDEQYNIYRKALDLLDGKPLTIRTLDIGGDKRTAYLNLPKEENPFLGYRGIRVSLKEQEIFKTQLRAIYRASKYGDIKIMFPMVCDLNEIKKVKLIIDQVKKQLRSEKIAFNEDIKIGIMVETPSAAIHSRIFAKEVDFFSIGTNDLIQYTCAVDRGNQNVAYLYDQFNPAVLKLIKMTIDSGHDAGIKVSMCGQAASNEKLIPLFLAMGLDEFSMDSASILKSKYIIKTSSRDQITEELDTILDLYTGEEVENYLDKCLNIK